MCDRLNRMIRTSNSFGNNCFDYTYESAENLFLPQYGMKADTNPFRYCGEYFDEETGFVYLRARYYSPDIGRFVSEDTHWTTDNMIFGDNGHKDNQPNILSVMQSSNLYVYCGNNPIVFYDCSGNTWYEVLNSIFDALSVEIGFGYGIGASFTLQDVKVGITTYQNPVTLGISENHTFTSTSGGFEAGIAALGYSIAYEHRYETDGEKFRDGHNTFSSPLRIIECDHTTTSEKVNFMILSTNQDNDLIIEYSAKIYVIGGAAFSVEFNVNKFLESLADLEE